MNTHDIHVVKKHASGAEEWFCPTCQRRFVVQWSPEYQFIVLEAGDVEAIHNMGRGAMVLAAPSNPESLDSLAPWLEWLKTINLEDRLGETDN